MSRFTFRLGKNKQISSQKVFYNKIIQIQVKTKKKKKLVVLVNIMFKLKNNIYSFHFAFSAKKYKNILYITKIQKIK